jgi:CHASE2 domain-containing sensor protein
LVAGSPSLSPEPLSATPAEITAPPGGPPELDIPRQTAAGWIGSLRLRKSAIICAVAAALTLALLSMTSLRWLDFLSMDLLFALRGAQAPPEEIVVVAIDDASFEELRLRWPWPRDLHAKLIDALFRAGVKAVAFDVHFAQPSSDPGQDAALAAAVNDHPAVVLSGKYQVTGYATGDSYSWIPPAETVLAPESESGFLNASDPDGVVRLIPTMLAGRPSLSLLAAETYLEQTVGRGKPDRLQVPAELLINFVGPAHSVDTISYYRALDPEGFELGTSLEDKLAFVGLASNEIQADYRPTPFTRSGHGLMYGVEIHANAAHNLLQGNFLTEPHPVVLSSVSFLIATLSGILLFSMNPRRSGALFTGVCVASVSASFVVFARYNLAVSVSKLIGPLLVVFLTSLWYRYNDIYRSEQRIRRILAGQRVRMQEGDGIKTAVRVFVSYNDEEEDAKYAAAILDYVKGLNNEGVEFWSKRDLITGDAKIEEIQERIDSSCMAMVLVSQSYLNCRDCVDIELRRILTKRLTVFPIILSPCDWESQPWLSSLKVLPNRNETFAAHYRERASRDQILLQVLKDLRKRVRKVSR